jgi:hypothetical protein
MLKMLLKLAIMLLVAHALFRFVPPYWNHHQFESELQERAVTWRGNSEQDIRQQVLEMAHEHGVPITGEQIEVRRDREDLFVEVSYSRPIELIPGWKYDWPFTSNVDALIFKSVLPKR